MNDSELKHFHTLWWDIQELPDPHVLCQTAASSADAKAEAVSYLGESLGSIEKVYLVGDEASWQTCRTRTPQDDNSQ